MLENLNNTLFLMINATPASAQWQISLATFLAKDLILIVPVLAAAMWLWGERRQVHAQRHLVVKVATAMAVSLTISGRWANCSRMSGRLLPTSVITSCITQRTTLSQAIMAR